MSENWFSREAKSNGDEHKNINSDSRVLINFHVYLELFRMR